MVNTRGYAQSQSSGGSVVQKQGSFANEFKITSEQGNRSNPFGGGNENHKGIDYAMPMNTPLAANIAGTVVYAGFGKSGSGYGGYGNAVGIRDAQGNVHVYGHLNGVNVKVGQTVSVGQLLGKTGSTGQSTGAHLHYEVRKNGQLGNVLDPRNYFGNTTQSRTSSTTPTISTGGSKPWINQQAGKFVPMFQAAGRKYGVDPNILMALSMQESSMGKTTGKNIMEANGGVAGGGQFNSYEASIDAGTKEFAARYREAGGDVRKALAAYNMGAGLLKWFDQYSGGQYSKSVVQQYSNYYAKKYGWRRYGDVNYVDNVLRYYK